MRERRCSIIEPNSVGKNHKGDPNDGENAQYSGDYVEALPRRPVVRVAQHAASSPPHWEEEETDHERDDGAGRVCDRCLLHDNNSLALVLLRVGLLWVTLLRVLLLLLHVALLLWVRLPLDWVCLSLHWLRILHWLCLDRVCLRLDRVCLRLDRVCLRLDRLCLRLDRLCLRFHGLGHVMLRGSGAGVEEEREPVEGSELAATRRQLGKKNNSLEAHFFARVNRPMAPCLCAQRRRKCLTRTTRLHTLRAALHLTTQSLVQPLACKDSLHFVTHEGSTSKTRFRTGRKGGREGGR